MSAVVSPSKHSIQESSKRIFGLDILRSFAILSVVISHILIHYNYFVKYVMHETVSRTAASLSILSGIYGVELFFALSGFLIGQVVF